MHRVPWYLVCAVGAFGMAGRAAMAAPVDPPSDSKRVSGTISDRRHKRGQVHLPVCDG